MDGSPSADVDAIGPITVGFGTDAVATASEDATAGAALGTTATSARTMVNARSERFIDCSPS